MENTEKEQIPEDIADTDSNDKFKPWQILIIIFTVLFALGVIILFVLYGVLSLSDSFGKNFSQNNEEINIKTEISENDKKISEFSENPYDLQFVIGGYMYQLPVTVTEVLKDGWVFGLNEDAENVIPVGETAETYFTLSDGTVVFATLKNFGNEEITLRQAYIVGVKFDKDYIGEKSYLTFFKNLSLGVSGRKYAENIFGKCHDIFKINSGTVLNYEKGEKSVKLIFDNSTGKLKEIEYINTSSPEDFSENAFKNISSQRYKKPEELGDNLVSGVMEIEGDLYKLPIPVSEFLKNGWEISFKEDDKTTLSGNEYAFGTLSKDGVIIPDAEIYNLDKTKNNVENCYVISMAVSSESEFNVSLPKDIKTQMTEDDFLIAVSGLNCTLNSAEFNQYTFTDGKINLTVDVDKQENKVKYWIMRYEIKTE